MINNLSQLKSQPQQKIKGKDKGREMKTQGQHCFLSFSVFVKTKYFPKIPKTLKNLFVYESTNIDHVKTHFNKYNHTNEYGIH